MNTDTPRTDEAAVDVWRKSNGERMATSSDKVDADFARCLERELNEARFDLDFSRRLADWQSKTIDDLTAQRDEARERERVAIVSWEEERQRALREGQRVVEAMEKNAKLRDIAERAINYLDQSYRDGFSDEASDLRYELAQLKEETK
jgi:hypothetical protein